MSVLRPTGDFARALPIINWSLDRLPRFFIPFCERRRRRVAGVAITQNEEIHPSLPKSSLPLKIRLVLSYTLILEIKGVPMSFLEKVNLAPCTSNYRSKTILKLCQSILAQNKLHPRDPFPLILVDTARPAQKKMGRNHAAQTGHQGLRTFPWGGGCGAV